jgi:hypothetical protein
MKVALIVTLRRAVFTDESDVMQIPQQHLLLEVSWILW